ncbi:MAG: T9SS type A sorting domain-containing protein [Owenweeksia sp.]
MPSLRNLYLVLVSLPDMKITGLCSAILLSIFMHAQTHTRKALFLGNSYTYYNNLPQLIADMATSSGDTLIYDNHTPGGSSLWVHHVSPVSLAKIMQGGWDYVVLQDQSQVPSLDPSNVAFSVYPPARYLDSVITSSDACTETMFYMTWGRKNGDQVNCAAYPNWPYVCTYEGMDSLLSLRYRHMADTNNAVVSPVGAVWRYIRQNHPGIELYQADESHPSLAGSYAAACCFYTAIFRKDPSQSSFNAGLAVATAAQIRAAAKVVVYDSLLKWHIGEYDTSFSTSCPNYVNLDRPAHHLVEVYPNPAQSVLQVHMGEHYRGLLRICHVSGKVVREQAYGPPFTEISLTGLPAGIYWVQAGNDPTSVKRFIKD